MPPIELGPTRPISAVDLRIARQATGQREPAERTTEASLTVALSDAVAPGEAPVNRDRVDAIRKAIEEGSYPLVPARIADAVIAAGILLRSGK